MKVCEALSNMVINPNWLIWRQSSTIGATNINRMILNYIWWDCVEYLLNFTETVLSMICYINMNRLCLGKIYDGIDSMIEKIKTMIK